MVCVTHRDEFILGCKPTENLLCLGEVQSTDFPVDLHDAPELFIIQTICKLAGEALQHQQHYTTQLLLLLNPTIGIVLSHRVVNKWATLILSTSAPGGDSCRATVSDVSMVKYTSMGQTFVSRREKMRTQKHKLIPSCYITEYLNQTNVPCCVSETVAVQFCRAHCCSLVSGHESGLQREERPEWTLTPPSSSSPVTAHWDTLFSYCSLKINSVSSNCSIKQQRKVKTCMMRFLRWKKEMMRE